MAEVLRISPTLEHSFSSAGIRRTTSHNSLLLDTSAASQSGCGSGSFSRRYSSSLSSSAPSSPRLSNHDFSSLPSYSSTPASCLSLRDQFCADDTNIPFPLDDDEATDDGYDDEDVTPSNSPPKPSTPDAQTRPQAQSEVAAAPKSKKSVGDDLAVERRPARHVDYLSHDWEEEEIWSSWKHIVGKRKTLDNWERLENASWRTWAKSRGRLPTVSPAALNWMKDHDVTWLYGPLQSSQIPKLGVASPSSIVRLPRADSFITKSILKKRSRSDIILQQSLSNSTLVRRAVDSLVSQGPNSSRDRPLIGPGAISDASRTNYRSFPTPVGTPPQTIDSSLSLSGASTPSERKHIHFSERVQQCIAINKDGEDDHEDDEMDSAVCYDSDDSEEGGLTMRIERGKERRLSSSRSGTPRPSFSGDLHQRTIAMLPATKLRGATPEPSETATPGGAIWTPRSLLAKSSSQETLKPSRPSSNFLLDNADEVEGFQDQAASSLAPSASRRTSQQMHSAARFRSFVNEDEEMESRGLRRTASGMFMPYDDNEEDYGVDGVMGKVINAVNTAKDILHVVWNVGWRP